MTQSLRQRLLPSLFAAAGLGLSVLAAPVSAANVTVTYSPYGAPTVGGVVNSLDLTGKVGQSSFTVGSGLNQVSVTTQGGAVVQGSASNQYAAPVSGGSAASPVYYTAPYFSTGGTPNTITLSFASTQSYLGLLWGSIGTGDYISLLDTTGAEIGRVTGTQALAAANVNTANGSRDFGGSEYALINLSGGQFSKAVLGQSGGPSFEAANFEYSAQAVVAPNSVPEPTSFALAGIALAGCVVLRRKA